MLEYRDPDEELAGDMNNSQGENMIRDIFFSTFSLLLLVILSMMHYDIMFIF